MVDNSFSIAVFCICSAVMAVLLRQYSREQGLLASLAACTAVLAGAILMTGPMIDEVRDIFSQAGVSESYISLIFKAVAICFITQVTCEICRDSGENAIASAAELWGRGAVTLMSLPVARVLLELIDEII
jgi:stage III sporulation protein AD